MVDKTKRDVVSDIYLSNYGEAELLQINTYSNKFYLFGIQVIKLNFKNYVEVE